MTRKRHTVEQIIALLREAQVWDQNLCRTHGTSYGMPKIQSATLATDPLAYLGFCAGITKHRA